MRGNVTILDESAVGLDIDGAQGMQIPCLHVETINLPVVLQLVRDVTIYIFPYVVGHV